MASSSPMLQALSGAWRRSREALDLPLLHLRASRETGSHLVRTDNYSRVAGTASVAALPAGRRIESARFFVGGHEWQLHFYPNGADESASPGRASVQLVLGGSGSWHATAAYEVSILDGEGKLVLGRAFPPRRFSAVCDQDAEVVVAMAVEMRATATRGEKEEDGRIVVRCDVTVTILEKD